MPLGKEVGLGPGRIVLDGDPVGTQFPTAAPGHFRPMPIVAKRSPISATAELLFHIIDTKLNSCYCYHYTADTAISWRLFFVALQTTSQVPERLSKH